MFIPLLALVSCNPKPEKTEGVKLNANTPTPKPDNPDGEVIDPNGEVIDPNGEVIDPNGEVIDPNGGAADQQDEALKQGIIDYLIDFIIPAIKQTINIHTNTTWNEGKQDYIISGATQFFGVIQYTDAKKQKKLYNTQDDESKTARREMYLGFGYFPPYIEAFGKLANKMAATKNVQMKTELANMVDKIRQYARAYYLTAYNTLNDKQDKLMKLDLNDIETLRTKLQAIHSANNGINSIISSIQKDYHEDIKIGTAKHQLKTTATAEEIQKYLKDKFDSAESDFDKAINTANEIAGILNKIQ
ncbi:Putative membrane spanning protein (plasmid) [Borrelia nietonii YOR]|uniref:Putative membrane spanning protein n=1 Tax=Borrelia nietonii YOR TaxID=1293576 RepID=W5SBP8_9SPIR|nr:virulence associated lipoprotein [Borrelia nietonii]AHH04138.1 Putative membrane spanning protein [Borrelia nietonii YOR]